MKDLTLFVSSKCPDCPPAIEYVKNSGVDVNIVDITESMKNLKLFLKYRDKDPYFDITKAANNVGVPTFMVGDGEKFFSFEEGMDLKKEII